MTRIKQSDVMAPALKVQAESFIRSRGNGRVRVARVYRLEKTRDGSGAQEYVLVRYETKEQEVRSALLLVEGNGFCADFRVVRDAARGGEKAMMSAWYDAEGAIRDGLA